MPPSKRKLKIIVKTPEQKKLVEEKEKEKPKRKLKIVQKPDSTKMNIVDIGSHNGKTKNPTHKYLSNPKYQVYHVEPNTNMKEDLEKLNSIKSYCAVSDYNGEGKLYFDKRGFLSRKKGEKVNKKKGMRNSLERQNEHINFFLSDNYITVEVKTLDKLLKDLHLTSVELLKIDTEGSDYKILKNYSFKIKPKKIMTEDFFETNKDKYKLLEKHGYKLDKKTASDSFWSLQ